MVDVREAITRAHHEEWARVVAALTRRFGDLDIAEEAAAEAFATAVERWPADGVPPNPGAWLTTTANRKAIDRIRRESKRDDKQKEAQMLYDDDPPEPLGAIDDDRLRLIFTCCHPALAMETRVALTLRMVGGLTVPEIARAFLVQETAMGQRITRAKAKIKAARIPYRVREDVDRRVHWIDSPQDRRRESDDGIEVPAARHPESDEDQPEEDERLSEAHHREVGAGFWALRSSRRRARPPCRPRM